MTRQLLLILLLVSPLATTAGADDPQLLRKGMEITCFDDLVADLNQKSVLHQVVAEQNLALLPVKYGHLDCMAGMRWTKQTGFLLILVPMFIVETDERLREIESAIARINYDHPSGGFNIAYGTREVFFRMSVPFLPAGKLDSNHVTEYFSYSVREASRFKPALAAVAEGRVAGRDVLTYFITLPGDDNRVPAGTFRKQAGDVAWKLTISESGDTTLHRGETEVVRSMATATNGILTFTDKQGELSVETPGRYRFRFPKGKLRFEHIEDASADRRTLLTEGEWEIDTPANSPAATTPAPAPPTAPVPPTAPANPGEPLKQPE